MVKAIKNIRVVKVLSPSQLVLNVGEEDGIEIGDEFIIYGLSDEDIIDPETNENLGKLELYRGVGSVFYLQPKICILQSISNQLEKLQISLGGTGTSCFISAEVMDYAKFNATKTKLVQRN